MVPASADPMQRGFVSFGLARIYAMVGEKEAAIERLEYLLSIPSLVSVPLLRADPTWECAEGPSPVPPAAAGGIGQRPGRDAGLILSRGIRHHRKGRFVRFQPTITSLIAVTGVFSSGRAPEPPVVTIEANDFAFALPDRVAAGIVTFRLVNRGKESHHAQIIRLEDGKTAGDFIGTFVDTVAMPGWVRYVGGPVGTAPGQERRATSRLTPGSYAVLCRIVSPDGRTHVMKGMIREFQVVAGSDAAPDWYPTASDTIVLNDYGFVSHRPLTAGRHTIRVENAGPQPHEIVMLALAPGKTPADFARWGLGGRHGPPPGVPVGGAEFLDQGSVGTFSLDLAPGSYGFICFAPDTKDGKRHFLHGMMMQFTVPT